MRMLDPRCDLNYHELYELFSKAEGLSEEAFNERLRQLHLAGRLTVFGSRNNNEAYNGRPALRDIPKYRAINFRYTHHCGGCMVRDFGRAPTVEDVHADLAVCERGVLTETIMFTKVRFSGEEAYAILSAPTDTVAADAPAVPKAESMIDEQPRQLRYGDVANAVYKAMKKIGYDHLSGLEDNPTERTRQIRALAIKELKDKSRKISNRYIEQLWGDFKKWPPKFRNISCENQQPLHETKSSIS
jgi:hypothetical protein